MLAPKGRLAFGVAIMPQASPLQNPGHVTLDRKLDIAVDSEGLLAWYDRQARVLPWRVSPQDRQRDIRPNPYRVWLSEIMLQQTNVVTVGDYFRRFLTIWPNVQALAGAPLDDILVQWAGLGYYARARNLHLCAQIIVAEHGGNFPDRAEALQALPGIGPYTSAAIAAICFDEQVAVVDGNVERVMARFLTLDVPVRDAKPLIREQVQRAVPERAGDFAQAMMDLGASLCAPRAASCLLCPIQPGCAGAASGQPTDFPVKPIKVERPVRFGHAFIFMRDDGAIWLRKRPEKGLLAKMTEVPGSDWTGDRQAVVRPKGFSWRKRGQVVHIFTHFRLELDVWITSATELLDRDGWWSPVTQLPDEALPSLFRKVIAVVGEP